MKKISVLIFVLLIIFALSGCKHEIITSLGEKITRFSYDRKYENTRDEHLRKAEYRRNVIDANTREHDVFDRVDLIGDIKKFEPSQTGVYSSAGVYASKKCIAILNSEKSNIQVIDWDGNILKTIGRVGSGELEFNKPSAICFNDYLEKYYIYDSGNSRVVVLDADFNFIENINIKFPVDHYIKELGSEDDSTSIAVDNDENIYMLPYIVYSEKTAYLYKFDKNGNAEKLYDFLCGVLKMIDGKIYLIQNMEFYQFDKEFYAYMGEEYLFELIDDKLIEICSLPYKYYTDDIEISNDDIYLYSSSWVSLQKFKLKNNSVEYVGTLTPQIIPPKSSRLNGYGRYMTTSRYKNLIVMGDRFTGNIYIVNIK